MEEDKNLTSFPSTDSPQRLGGASDNGVTSTNNNTTKGGFLAPDNTLKKPVIPRAKVVLEPGHSPIDWARLKSSGRDLRVRVALAASRQDRSCESELTDDYLHIHIIGSHCTWQVHTI